MKKMNINQTRQGELFIVLQAILWALFPIVTIKTYSSLSPLVSAAFGTFFSIFFFAGVLTVRGTWRDVRNTSVWKDIVILTLILGVLFYGLMFLALQYSTAGNVSIIGLMEVFFSYLIVGVIYKQDTLDKWHIIGSLFMVVGAFLVLFPGNINLLPGDALMLLASAVPPIGNMYAQRVRKLVSTECVMFLRSCLAAPILLAASLVFDGIPSFNSITSNLSILALNGILLLGVTKILWLEGLHRISIPKAISLSSISPLFTLIFAYFFLGESITLFQVIGFIPILIGVQMLTKRVQ